MIEEFSRCREKVEPEQRPQASIRAANREPPRRGRYRPKSRWDAYRRAVLLDKANPPCAFRPLHIEIPESSPATAKIRQCTDTVLTPVAHFARATSVRSCGYRAGVTVSAITGAFFLLTCATTMG